MPADRELAEDLAQRLGALYGDLEQRLARGMAVRLASGMEAPQWAADKLAAVGQLRRWVETLLARLDGPMRAEVAQALVLAYARGGDAALGELARLQSTHPEWLRLAQVSAPNDALRAAIARRGLDIASRLRAVERALPGGHALQRLVWSLTSRLSGTHLPILRWAEDAYRTVVAQGAAPGVLAGIDTRRLASQRAWNQLLTRGITGFTDAAGRRWNLASYVEMSTRTSVAQAAVEGHLDRLSSIGLDLVIVSDAPQECKRCRPWEGKVLTRGGSAGGGKRTVVIDDPLHAGRTVAVEVAGSIDDAIAAGLMHPNCRHSINAYVHGVTRIPTNTQDPEGDKARQRLRALERRVRALKLRQAGALTPASAREIGAEVRNAQAQIREHVAATEHLGIRRKPERERLNLGNVRQ
jgi:hypothetical protein